MKSTLHSFVLTVLFMLLCQSLSAFEVDGIYYKIISELTVEVTGGPYNGNVSIPSSVTYSDNTYTVTSIGESAFRNHSGLTSVSIPNSVTSIGNYAFAYCSGLTSISIPNSVTSIGHEAFEYCSGLTSINIPNSVTSINSCAFLGCTGLTSINIPNSVTSIGHGTFSGCTGLTNITIPNSVTSIESYAFDDCSGLTSINIPNSVTSIGEGAFNGCSGLTSINIPNSVTSIGRYAFAKCTGLTNITIPNCVSSIGNGAFQDCSGLTSITIPNNLTTITHEVFQGCTRLTSITIPNSVTSIGNAFGGCTGLTSITIPSSVTEIIGSAFYDCRLREVQVLGETPASISGKAFSNQVKYHATLLVPYGCFDKYAYDDSWYQFIHIKENAGTKENLSPKQAYELKNSATRSYIVYDAVNDAVRSIGVDANIDEDNANHNWQVVESNGNTYIYNIGAKKYLYAEGSDSQLKLSTTPVAISMSDGENGIQLGNAGEWLFVLNNQLAVDESVSDIEQLAIESKLDAYAPTYSLHGTKVQATQQKGLFVRNGKKMQMK